MAGDKAERNCFVMKSLGIILRCVQDSVLVGKFPETHFTEGHVHSFAELLQGIWNPKHHEEKEERRTRKSSQQQSRLGAPTAKPDSASSHLRSPGNTSVLLGHGWIPFH